MTLILVCLTAALLVLANLSIDARKRGIPVPSTVTELRFDSRSPDDWYQHYGTATNLSYGWPLLWHQYVYVVNMWSGSIVGECSSLSRLAGNVLSWLFMLVVPASLCEWLLRRYWPRPHWSLRTMFLIVAVIAGVLAWFVAVRRRADFQDSLIAALQRGMAYGEFLVDRRGPQWLDVIGAERYRRFIVGASINLGEDWGDRGFGLKRAPEVFTDLSRLPDVRYLALSGPGLTPEVAQGLCDMPQLRMLRIHLGHRTPEAIDAILSTLQRLPHLQALSVQIAEENVESSHACLRAIGRLTQLEYLQIEVSTLRSSSLECLADLSNLKWFSLWKTHRPKEDKAVPLLSRLPVLPRLEVVDVSDADVGGLDIRCLARLPRLKALTLWKVNDDGAGLSELANSQSLEELSLDGVAISAKGLESLRGVKQLKKLHLQNRDYRTEATIVPNVPEMQVDACLEALESLRRSKPQIVIDSLFNMQLWPSTRLVLSENAGNANRSPSMRWAETVRQWEEENSLD